MFKKQNEWTPLIHGGGIMNLMRPPRPNNNANTKKSYSTVPKAGPGIRAADLAKLAKVGGGAISELVRPMV